MRYLSILLLLTASAAHAESWLEVAKLDSKGSVLLLETTGIDRSRELRKASFKSVYTADRPIADGYRGVAPGVRSYRWEQSQGYFNCAERTVAVSQSILHGADDKVVGSVDVDQTLLKFREVPPGSFGGLMIGAVCSPAASESQPAAPPARITYVANPDDYYPSGSKRRGEEGAPVVKVCVGPTGALLREPDITDSSGFPDIDGAAVKVAKANRYAAAIVDGAKAEESCMKFKVKFARLNH
jgi:TonB family protein